MRHRYASPLIAELAITVALQLPLRVMRRGGKSISDRGIDSAGNSHFSDARKFPYLPPTPPLRSTFGVLDGRSHTYRVTSAELCAEKIVGSHLESCELYVS